MGLSELRVNKVYEGDCLEVMRQLPDNCIDTILTDPPYGLEFMGKNWDHGIPGAAYWRECLRVAKPGATLLAFGGTRTYHRLVCAIEDAGWQIRDCITYFHDASHHQELAFMASLNEEQLAAYLELHYPNMQLAWVYGSGFPKSGDISKMLDKQEGAEREVVRKHPFPCGVGYNGTQSIGGRWQDVPTITSPASPIAQKWDGWKSHGLKPAYEPIVLARKPMGQSYADNARQWGVSGLNVDGSRIETDGSEELRRNAKGGENGLNGTSTFKIRERKVDDKPFYTGRYPANLIHDNSPEVEAVFAKAGVSVSKKGHRDPNGSMGYHGGASGTNYRLDGHNDTGTPSRFFAKCPADRFYYHPKAPPSERSTPGNNHPTQKPLSLIRELAKLTKTPDGGVVLDPFAGSGTTALACIAEGRDYILIEKKAEYCEIIKRRIAEYNGEAIEEKKIELSNNETVKQMPLW